jgi:endonuclease-8
VPDEVGVTAGRIGDEDRLYVYKRDGLPCHRCGDEIRLVEIAKRKAWWCPTCQR